MIVDTWRKKILLILVLGLFSLQVVPGAVQADHANLTEGKKILVVASYHQEYRRCREIVQTLEYELKGAQLTLFYMDTKKNPAGAAEKAAEAYELYRNLQPDAVIAIDDNAQEYFVVPYLKNKVATPVIFCAVNNEAGKYGFPAANVTGVLEKKHYRESISFAQIIEPRIRTLAVLYKPCPSNSINIAHIEREKYRYTANLRGFIPVDTMADIWKALDANAASVDAFLLLDMTGITDKDNVQIEGHEVIRRITRASDKVTIGASNWEIEAGALCGVIKSGEEQGVLAARQLIAYWEGSPIRQIPVLENKYGQRYLNLQTLKKLKLQLQPEMIIGTTIISGQ